MDREDLRKTLSGVQADIELSTCLREHPSLDYQLSHYETSGVDCLVNLIRHTNDMLSEPSMTERQEENPLLAYAWQAFFPRDVDEELTTHRFAVKRGVLEFLSTRIHSTLTFEQCCDSDLMNETKWSSDEWLLYESIRSGSSTEDRRREGGAASLIEYDCRQNPNWSLQDAVDSHLASKKEQSHLAMTRPVFVRVRYHSHADDPKPFGDIVTFHLPTTGGTAVTDDQVSRPFSLKAIVRMRDAIGERDYMRPYDHGGVVIDQFETKTLTPRDHSAMLMLEQSSDRRTQLRFKIHILGKRVRLHIHVTPLSNHVRPLTPIKWYLALEKSDSLRNNQASHHNSRDTEEGEDSQAETEAEGGGGNRKEDGEQGQEDRTPRNRHQFFANQREDESWTIWH
ncbi:hypothetical protein H9Q69_001299 [Fusarium xylarioides]|nr:hypothetical protein H9Q69_001299 [Fusarium xylarioides]